MKTFDLAIISPSGCLTLQRRENPKARREKKQPKEKPFTTVHRFMFDMAGVADIAGTRDKAVPMPRDITRLKRKLVLMTFRRKLGVFGCSEVVVFCCISRSSQRHIFAFPFYQPLAAWS